MASRSALTLAKLQKAEAGIATRKKEAAGEPAEEEEQDLPSHSRRFSMSMAGLGLMDQESALRTALALAAGDRSSASSSSAPQAATKQTSGIAKRQRAEAEIAARADGTGEEEEKTAGPAPWPPNVGIKGGKRQQEYVENIHDDLPDNVDRALGPADSTEEVASLRTQTLCQESLDDTPMTNGSIVAALSTIMNINAGNIKEVIDMTTNDGDGKEVIDNSKKSILPRARKDPPEGKEISKTRRTRTNEADLARKRIHRKTQPSNRGSSGT